MKRFVLYFFIVIFIFTVSVSMQTQEDSTLDNSTSITVKEMNRQSKNNENLSDMHCEASKMRKETDKKANNYYGIIIKKLNRQKNCIKTLKNKIYV